MGSESGIAMTDQTYEGWKNWDTWSVTLLLNNIYEYYVDYIAYMRKHGDFTPETLRCYCAGLFERKIKGVNMDHSDPESEYYINFDNVDWVESATYINLIFSEHGDSSGATE